MSFRTFNWSLLVFSGILELVALYCLVCLLYSHCVLGGEYGISVWAYTYFLPVFTAQTLVLMLFRMCGQTIGLDPIATVFNLISGIMCIILALILLFSMWAHCSNEFAIFFFVSGSCGLIAGILHLCNGILCLFFMPPEEANYLKPISKLQKKLQNSPKSR
ncbi:uncharacterized protein LOC6568637 [Drosophila grimshawi]|uniref:uncharacterized protein LOC6568637 n=1 Tax=Drosophila grimshawi TaxID=7222 RepID=UPI001C93604B|nr:uncharacterized protein LOC6568637 [Drosophila grimshawi]